MMLMNVTRLLLSNTSEFNVLLHSHEKCVLGAEHITALLFKEMLSLGLNMRCGYSWLTLSVAS